MNGNFVISMRQWICSSDKRSSGIISRGEAFIAQIIHQQTDWKTSRTIFEQFERLICIHSPFVFALAFVEFWIDDSVISNLNWRKCCGTSRSSLVTHKSTSTTTMLCCFWPPNALKCKFFMNVFIRLLLYANAGAIWGEVKNDSIRILMFCSSKSLLAMLMTLWN